MRCLTCQYDLRRLKEHRCPECGRAFDPADLNTFEWWRGRRGWERLKPVTWVGLVIMLIGLLTTIMFACGFWSLHRPRH